ncbi:MAG TPA: O-antigen ligase family protein [Vicinamibacterales bacterium]|nr:O-antigen ligase family protein [Vicinamibacterales bacterium]
MSERLTFNAPVPSGAALSAGTAPPVDAAPPDGTTVSFVEPRDRAFTWMLLFTAVLFLRPQDLLPPLDFLHLAELTATLGLGSLIASRLARGQAISRMTPELVGVVLFGAVIVLTAPFSIWMGGAIEVFRDMYSKVILVYILAVNTITTPKRLERITWVLVLVVGYVALLTMVDYLHGTHMVGHGTRAQGAVGGIMGNPNDLATNMVAFLPLAAFTVLRRSSGIFKRAAAAGCAVLMLAAAVASGSRGGFLGMIVMIAVFGAMAVRKRPGLVVAAAFAGLCALPLVPSTYWHRISSITDESKDDFGSAQERRTLIKESIEAFSENPLVGVGAGNFKAWNPNGRSAAWHESHNVILQVASELGIVGLSVFFFIVGRAFQAVFATRRLVRRARRAAAARRTGNAVDPTAPQITSAEAELLDAHSAAMLASLCGWLICAVFASVAYTWTLYYLVALAATPRDMLRDRQPRHAASRVPTGAIEVAHA